MVNTSKVLTVSYGTFSCTLEGFDDSFDTMKAIAEYFRDLAADDRYFGAEPPTPDAEMLARIAEREVSRRVEATNDGGNIVLRTTLPVAAPIAEQPVQDDALSDQPDAEVDSDALDADDVSAEQARLAEQAEKEARLEEERVEKEAAERAAARAARRARREEEQAAKEAAEQQAAAEAAQKAEAEAEAKRAAEEEAEAKRIAEQEAQARREAEQAAEAARKAKDAAEARAKEQADAAQQAETPADPEDTESVAAKLARIRAVVGQPKAASDAVDFSEDEHADDIVQGQPGNTDLEDLLEEDQPHTTSAEDTISGVMSRLAADTSEDAAQPQTEQAPATEPELQEPEIEVAETPEPAKAPIRARVIKMKREEFEAAIASGDIEEEEDDDTDVQGTARVEAPAETPVDDSSLSPDDEDELARELAAVEAELAGLPQADATPEAELDHAEPQHVEVMDTPDQTAAHAPKASEDLAIAPDAEMDRLMDQASSELEEPDGKKRRNALGHLRAAVAAARADKSSGRNAEKVDDTLTYRDDLQSAVQPSRPVRRLSSDANAAATVRPPLKLVAEQRVDAPSAQIETEAAPAVARPVRPRRIKAGDAPAAATAAPTQNVDLAPEGGTFSEFAEEMGATELPDLLEAAAAYLAYIEGKDQFSRPQLMTKVRMVQDENFSREDGLRSFGQLLRQGKIEKISGGRFTVSDRISFKPDTRAAG